MRRRRIVDRASYVVAKTRTEQLWADMDDRIARDRT